MWRLSHVQYVGHVRNAQLHDISDGESSIKDIDLGRVSYGVSSPICNMVFA